MYELHSNLVIDVMLSRFWQCNAFWSIALPLGFEGNLKQINAYENIYFVVIATVGISTRMHCIYRNLDKICYGVN